MCIHRPEAYTSGDIKYIIRILLQIRLDRVGDFIARDIENAIESTLSALNEETWETEVDISIMDENLVLCNLRILTIFILLYIYIRIVTRTCSKYHQSILRPSITSTDHQNNETYL